MDSLADGSDADEPIFVSFSHDQSFFFKETSKSSKRLNSAM